MLFVTDSIQHIQRVPYQTELLKGWETSQEVKYRAIQKDRLKFVSLYFLN
jgi:hypothetical protein